MDARFDHDILRLPNWVRAIDVGMFGREAWGVRARLDSEASCLKYHIANGPVGGVGLQANPAA